jgi:hypothetical protein
MNGLQISAYLPFGKHQGQTGKKKKKKKKKQATLTGEEDSHKNRLSKSL